MINVGKYMQNMDPMGIHQTSMKNFSQHSFQPDGEGVSPRMLAMTIIVKETCPWTSQDTSYAPPPTKNFMTHHCTSTNGGSSIVNILQCSITKGQLNLCRSYLTQLWVFMVYSHGWNPEIQNQFYHKIQVPLGNLWSELSDSKVMWFNPGWLMMGFRAIPHGSMGKKHPLRQPGNLWSLHRKKNPAQRQAQKGPALSPDCSLYRSIVSRCI